MTHEPAAPSLDPLVDKMLDLVPLIRTLAGTPETAYLAWYNPVELRAFIRSIGAVNDLATLERMAADPNTPPEALRFLAGICPRAFCANPALDLLLLENPNLPAEIDADSLGRLLSYAGVPPELLAAIAGLGAPAGALAARLHIGRAGVAGPDWSADLTQALAQLTDIPNDDLLRVLLALDAVPGWLRSRVAVSAAVEATDGVVSTAPPAPSPTTITLSDLEAEDVVVRAAVCAHPDTPPELLANAKRAEDVFDNEPLVYEALAGNPRTPPAILAEIAANMIALNTGARRLVARNPSAPPAALAQLAEEPYAADIRLLIAAHPNLGPGERAALLRHSLSNAANTPHPIYQAIAMAHPSADPERLEALSYAPHWLVRLAVAGNPATPAAARARLADDGNRLVGAAARAVTEHGETA